PRHLPARRRRAQGVLRVSGEGSAEDVSDESRVGAGAGILATHEVRTSGMTTAAPIDVSNDTNAAQPMPKWFDWSCGGWFLLSMVPGLLLGICSVHDWIPQPGPDEVRYRLGKVLQTPPPFGSGFQNLRLEPNGDNRFVGTCESTEGEVLQVKA